MGSFVLGLKKRCYFFLHGFLSGAGAKPHRLVAYTTDMDCLTVLDAGSSKSRCCSTGCRESHTEGSVPWPFPSTYRQLSTSLPMAVPACLSRSKFPLLTVILS